MQNRDFLKCAVVSHIFVGIVTSGCTGEGDGVVPLKMTSVVFWSSSAAVVRSTGQHAERTDNTTSLLSIVYISFREMFLANDGEAQKRTAIFVFFKQSKEGSIVSMIYYVPGGSMPTQVVFCPQSH